MLATESGAFLKWSGWRNEKISGTAKPTFQRKRRATARRASRDERARRKAERDGATLAQSPSPTGAHVGHGAQLNIRVHNNQAAYITKESLEHNPTIPTLTDMASRRTTLTPLLRSLAMATLLCWLGALVLCATECSDGDSDHQTGQKEMAASNSDNGSMPDSDNHAGHDDSVCNSLKTLVPTTCNLVLLKPDFGFCTLSFVSLTPALTDAQVEASVSRQPPNTERLSAPEVYLGAAFRSLAPPVLA